MSRVQKAGLALDTLTDIGSARCTIYSTRVLYFLRHPAFLVSIFVLIITTRGIADGGFRFSDASRHAMDGVFVSDVVRDLPRSILDPKDYAFRYYAHYPALGFFFYYPPFFACIEGLLFLLLGVSEVVARLSVVLFAVVGVVAAWNLANSIAGRRCATYASLAPWACPAAVFWSRQVMLEIPTAAMCVLSVVCFLRYLRYRTWSSSILASVAIIAAVMTKQPAVYVVLGIALYLVVGQRRDLLTRREFWVAMVSISVVVVPYMLLELKHARVLNETTLQTPGVSALLQKATKVMRGWSNILSWPGLLLVVSSMVVVVVRDALRTQGIQLLFSVTIAFAIVSVALGMGGDRYGLMGLPFLVTWPALLTAHLPILQNRIARGTIMIGLLMAGVFSYSQPVPAVRGYEDVALELLRQCGDSRVVLFDGYWDGDVVFFIRKHDPTRRVFVLRGSKLLYSFASQKELYFKEHVQSEREIARLLVNIGVGAVGTELPDIIGTRAGADLRKYVGDSEDYVYCSRLNISTGQPSSLRGLHVNVYRRRHASAILATELQMRLPGLGWQVIVPFSESKPVILVGEG